MSTNKPTERKTVTGKKLKRFVRCNNERLKSGVTGILGKGEIVTDYHTGEIETRYYVETEHEKVILPNSYAMPDLSEALGLMISVTIIGTEKTRQSVRNVYDVTILE